MNGSHVDQFVDFLKVTLDRFPNGFDDGVRFDIPTLTVERVKDGNVPGGKVTISAQIGKLALKIRSDLAFDARPVHERAVLVDYPSIVPGGIVPTVNVRHTPWEYTVADKVQAMVRHGAKNYRLRDYYDLYVILRNGKADLDLLPEALEHTFGLYGSDMPACADDIAALTDAFAAEKTARWDSERETKRYGDRVPDLAEVVGFLRETLDPVLLGMSAAPRPF